MVNRIVHIMLRQEVFLILASLASLSMAIRVDFNTNHGPIIPPTSTVPPVPKPPFREPSPVWEDQSDDIPNPNPYQYILPPPSRPKPLTDNFARAPLPPQDQYQQREPNYGQIISKPFNDNFKTVPGLAIQYVPNLGFKYHAVVPLPSTESKPGYLKENDGFEKYNKFNPKLKKFKAYEKSKYFPVVFYVTLPTQSAQQSQHQQYVQQQLYPTQQTYSHQQPMFTTQQTAFSAENYSTQSPTTTTTIMSTTTSTSSSSSTPMMPQKKQQSYINQYHKSANYKNQYSKKSYNLLNSLNGGDGYSHYKSRR